MPASLGQPPQGLELREAISVTSEAPDGKFLQKVQLESSRRHTEPWRHAVPTRQPVYKAASPSQLALGREQHACLPPRGSPRLTSLGNCLWPEGRRLLLHRESARSPLL